ncbi:hypothetical protein [Gimesia alba]|uniref:hypothetical protein n=1 Tax=Gimesia alba TaxID=2527973 RepID=UPI0011A3CC3F|nr:hypothetical protein [Gimesia alba]
MTVTFKRSGVADVDVSIAIAKRSAVDEESAMAAGVRLTGNDLFFHLPITLLEADDNYPGELRNADVITDAAGVSWVVKHHQLLSYGTRYKALCSQSRT